MEKVIAKKQSELKEMKKIFWQHYFENCEKKKKEIKEIKKMKRQEWFSEIKFFIKEIVIPSAVFTMVCLAILIYSNWLWN